MVTSVMVVPRWPQSYQSGGQHEGYLFSLANCSAVNSSVISPKLRRIIISKMLRSSSVLGAAGAARELDHGLVSVEERQARQLAPVAVTVEETNVPAFAIGKRHKDAVLSWPRRGQLHGGTVGEKKAKLCGSQRLFLHRDIALSSFWLVLPYADRLGCCGNSLARVGNVFR
jgi:hypothetical protein